MNFSRINKLVFVILLLLVSTLFMIRNREYFNSPVPSNEVIEQRNPSENIWDRQEIQDSLPVDYVGQYPNAYYHELNNEEFLNALKQTFQTSMIMMNGAEWQAEIPINRDHIPPENILNNYKQIVPWIETNINTSDKFELPGDKTSTFEIIHDYWKSWTSSVFTPNRYMYTVEVLIFREAKNHAKHVSFKIVIENDQIKGITEMGIIGIVPEDRFGLFPVIQSDEKDLSHLYQPFDVNPLAPYPTLINEANVKAEIDKRTRDNERAEKIEKYLKQTSPIQ